MSGLNIIVIEDHDDLREATVTALEKMGHRVRGVDCAESLDDELGAFRADLLVLDLNLPGEDGFSLARRMRAAEPDIGIIIVSARQNVRDKLLGYNSGADIYLSKPTTLEELGAAIRALSRRLRPFAKTAEKFTLDSLTLQLHGPQGTAGVSDQESTLLIAFAKAHDYRLESWQMIELAGGESATFGKAALEVLMVRLRKKLNQVGAISPTIKAIRGIGYQLCVPIVCMRSKN